VHALEEPNAADNGGVGYFEEGDAGAAQIGGRETEAKGPD